MGKEKKDTNLFHFERECLSICLKREGGLHIICIFNSVDEKIDSILYNIPFSGTFSSTPPGQAADQAVRQASL